MLDPGLVTFVTASLPAPPARLLEVGAGSGELAEYLAGAGYDVVAIDPASHTDRVQPVALDQLEAPDASFDAALAVLSLHHVEPLEASSERLAALLRPGAVLVVDEFDIAAFDTAAARWWFAQRREATTPDHAHGIVEDLRRHLHRVSAIVDALSPWFEFGQIERLPYLYRWELGPEVRQLEEHAIARGEIAATGARMVGRRR
ncbi:MAG TPA: class I SAM-dependent methyltransferase [Thermoleophilaceae bacterium]|nr:class I SAM-dependent methyltransferase [Thermoleophilaceae bacterium]